ncbi:unnamed protein product, partial [Prorocentrum cordatum]
AEHSDIIIDQMHQVSEDEVVELSLAAAVGLGYASEVESELHADREDAWRTWLRKVHEWRRQLDK